MKRFTLAAILAVAVMASGCPKDPYSIAVRSSDDVAGVITKANDGVDQIRQQGLITPVEEKSVLDYLHFGNTLNGQFQSCAQTVHDGGGTVAGYLACAKIFSNGLKDPKELASIRIVSVTGQNRVKIIIDGVQGVVDTLISNYGGN